MDLNRVLASADWQRLSDELRHFFSRHFGVAPPKIVADLPYLGEAVLPLAMPCRQPVAPSPEGERRAEPWHTPDFSNIVWQGQRWAFTDRQQPVARRLWEAWEEGRPAVCQEELLRAAGSEGSRLIDLFRGSPAWGRLIVRAVAGQYRLAIPTAEERERDEGVAV